MTTWKRAIKKATHPTAICRGCVTLVETQVALGILGPCATPVLSGEGSIAISLRPPFRCT
jgi:hypothetical protein